MFDNLTPAPEAGDASEAVKKNDTGLGQGNNIPANLASTFGSSIGNPATPKPVAPGLGAEFDQRMQKLEEKGKKRGIKFSRIGMIVASIIGLVMMGIGYYILTEVIGLTEKAQESSVTILRPRKEDTNGEKKINLDFSAEMLACEVDADCQVVQKQCCACEKGGALAAINKNFQSAWDTEFVSKCTNAVCDEQTKCPEGRAFCDSLKCRFVVNSAVQTASSTASSTEACVGDTCSINHNDLGTTTDNVWVANPNLTDNDQDGLSNADEAKYGTDMNNPDTDGDGLLDGEELKLKTNPTNSDSDGDEISDKDELTLGTDPLNPDTDGDGYSDGSELMKGYNPLGPGMLKKQ